MRQPKKRKVEHACVYCRRSHMTCDNQRPCGRCVKRNIGHLCHDEPRKRSESEAPDAPATVPSPAMVNTDHPAVFDEQVGSEFHSLNEFLSLMEDDMLNDPSLDLGLGAPDQGYLPSQAVSVQTSNMSSSRQTPVPDLPDVSATEKFMLTAADPHEGSAAVRLKEVIDAKVRAGLLKPYNYAAGYDRLRNYMDNYMNESSRRRIAQPLAMSRPAFRAVARSLNDLDLVMVEENFERLLLEYDRIFSSVAMPACLWRRTGEIYRGNKEFAELVECRAEDLRDGKLAIYELMSEDAAVNYWEKYGSIAFNTDQKAVVTTCNLRTRDGRKRRQCCFSFTIRRDQYNIPSIIVGNFIPIQKPL